MNDVLLARKKKKIPKSRNFVRTDRRNFCCNIVKNLPFLLQLFKMIYSGT